MLRRLSIVLFAAPALVVGLSGPTSAAAETTTETAKNVVDTYLDIVPSCDGGPIYRVTTTTNTVQHVTTTGRGGEHTTFTVTGKVSLVPLDSTLGLPSYAGRLTVRGGFNGNGRVVNATSTYNVTLKGSDGSKATYHENRHFNTRPNGTLHFVFRCH
ncbi:hypothetical protein ACFQU3_19730 [Terrabacter sp. GCM10028922]|uniref:hypothetical protein n=1 Tax=Terrabacter sp. GCM10028922 TaxID=3273428 RepID=UPI003617530F